MKSISNVFPSLIFKFLLGVSLLIYSHLIYAQDPMVFDIQNTSEFGDDELYVAIVGINNNAHVWVDMKTGQQMPMDPSYNTVKGPEIGGNKGPGLNGMYASCFTKLSEIPNKQVMLSPIYGCRMFIAMKSQLYFYFFGSTGATVGYTSPSHTNPTDPNTGINYEVIELTYNDIGFWGNTSRVDSYNYAMGLELYTTDGTMINTGELLQHEAIGQAYLSSVPSEFLDCYNPTTGQILQPTKAEGFSDGSVGTMPDLGPHRDYMQPYIDEIWSKYTNEDLIFEHPEIGRWSGRVVNDKFTFTCIGGSALAFIGEQGVIESKPNTQEAFEGKGVLDRQLDNPRFDLMMQAQVCAALTRHVIKVNVPTGTVQNWGISDEFYQESPCNHYAKFWHQQGIRVNELAYGFAYDDVYEQSSTMHSPNPERLKVVFGGYAPLIAQQSPYNGVATMIPGVLQNENYDLGGSGIAYNDNDAGNTGNIYRTDDVDVEENGQGGYNVGYLGVGEWLEYTVDVTTSGEYEMIARVANGGQIAGQFHLELNGNAIGQQATVPDSGAWNTWVTASLGQAELIKGEHIIRLVVDQEGFNIDEITFSPIIINTIPEVTVTSNGTTFTAPSTINLEGSVIDTDGDVTKVEFYNGSTLLGTDDSSPYTYSWLNVSAGTYSVTAKVYDAFSSFTSTSINLIVSEPNTIPEVTVTSNGTTFTAPSTINLEGSVVDTEGDVTKVEFYNGSTLLGTDVSSPYTYSWTNVSAGTYSVTAKVYDASSSFTSTVLMINVNPLVFTNESPTVTITSPLSQSNHDEFSGVLFTTQVNDSDGVIERVEFYNGDNLIGMTTQESFSFLWEDVLHGEYIITAVAFDDKGASTVSQSVRINVNELSTGLFDQKKAVGFLVYPNPAEDYISLKKNTEEQGQFTIYDVLGHAVMTSDNVQEQIDVSSFTSGSYIVKYETANQVYTTSFLVR